MASNLLRHLPKSYRQSPLNVKLQPTRNASGATSSPPGHPQSTPQVRQPLTSPITPQQPPIAPQIVANSSSNLKLAIGLALGVSLTMLANNNTVMDRVFPRKETPKEEKVKTVMDPKLVEHVISQDRKVNQLENQISSLRDELRERDRQEQSKQPQVISPRKTANVFELSEIIQANNMASEARRVQNLEDQRKVLVREHMLKVEGEILKVENKYRPVINKIRELEAHLENHRQIQQKEAPARQLWLSCQSLLDRLRDAPQQPLEKDPAYAIIKQFAANENQLAISVLEALPPKVLKEGIASEETLAARFQKVDKVCKRVALVGSHGAGLGSYLISYLQSLFIIDRKQPILDEEIRGQKLVDPTSWTTFDILARVNYCLERRNLEQAIRYANQLRGQARVVARDWIRDARLHLATRQAMIALMTHAEAIAVDSTRNGNGQATGNSSANFA